MTSSSSSLVTLHDAVVLVGGFPLLSGVNLELQTGSLSVVTGANGAGKTSLLRLIGGLVGLTSGTGRVGDIDLATGDRRELRRRVGWLGHEGSFYDDLSVEENLVFCAKALARPTNEIAGVLDRVELTSRASMPAKLLSAGQRRRLALAWILLRRPALWLLDEPYASLDDEGRNFLDQLIGDVVKSGATVLVSAHDPLRSSDLHPRTLTLAGGLVVGDRA
jgi:heme ABC exporter ATP-binding subunit CcmA